jgi:hypothetical protein
MESKAGRSHVVRFYGMQKNSWSPTGMNRQNPHFLAHLLLLQRSLELALADLALSLGHIRFHPGIVQQATGHSAETKPHPITTASLPMDCPSVEIIFQWYWIRVWRRHVLLWCPPA